MAAWQWLAADLLAVDKIVRKGVAGQLTWMATWQTPTALLLAAAIDLLPVVRMSNECLRIVVAAADRQALLEARERLNLRALMLALLAGNDFDDVLPGPALIVE